MIGGEIDYGMIQLDNERFHIVGPVQGPSLITQLAEKLTIGEHQRVDDVLLSPWIISNLRGGLGVARLDESTQSDRYRFGTLWTLQDQEITLPALPVEVTDGVPTDAEGLVGTTYVDTFYTVFGPQVRFYDAATNAMVEPTDTGYTDLSANATDILSIYMDDTDWLVIADANGYLQFDGTTWTLVTGNGTTIPKAKYLAEFDSKIYALDLNGKLWRTADLTTWTLLTATLPVRPSELRGLDLFFAPDESPKLHAAVQRGLLLYSTDDDIWQWTRLRFPRHSDGGLGHTMWRDEFYESAGMDVYHYAGSTVSPASLNRDDGLPVDYQGSIVALEAMPSWLAAAVSGNVTTTGTIHYDSDAFPFDATRATDVAGNSAIYIFGGSAWQPLWVSSVPGSAIHFLHYSDADDTYRLWWTANERAYYIEFAQAIFQPRNSPSWPVAQSGFLETGRFDGNWTEQYKLAVRTKIRLEDVVASGGRAYVEYRIDRADLWTLLGVADTDGVTIFEMEDTVDEADGLLYLDFEYRVRLERGTDPTLRPKLIFLKQEYIRRPDARFSYRFQVTVDEGSQGRTPEELVTHMQAIAAEKHLVQFEYRPSDRSPITGKAMIGQWTAIGMPGTETSARYMVSVILP